MNYDIEIRIMENNFESDIPDDTNISVSIGGKEFMVKLSTACNFFPTIYSDYLENQILGRYVFECSIQKQETYEILNDAFAGITKFLDVPKLIIEDLFVIGRTTNNDSLCNIYIEKFTPSSVSLNNLQEWFKFLRFIDDLTPLLNCIVESLDTIDINIINSICHEFGDNFFEDLLQIVEPRKKNDLIMSMIELDQIYTKFIDQMDISSIGKYHEKICQLILNGSEKFKNTEFNSLIKLICNDLLAAQHGKNNEEKSNVSNIKNYLEQSWRKIEELEVSIAERNKTIEESKNSRKTQIAKAKSEDIKGIEKMKKNLKNSFSSQEIGNDTDYSSSDIVFRELMQKDAEIEALRISQQLMEAKLKKYEHLLIEKEEEIKNLKEKLELKTNNFNIEISNLRQKLNQTELEIEKQKFTIEHKENEINELQHNNANTPNNSSLQAEIQELKSMIAKLKEENEKFKTENANNENTINSLNDKIKTMEMGFHILNMDVMTKLTNCPKNFNFWQFQQILGEKILDRNVLKLAFEAKYFNIEFVINAALNGRLDILKELESFGVNMKIHNKDGWTILHAFALDGSKEGVNYSLQFIDINDVDKNDETALHFAAKYTWSCDVIEQLFKYKTLRSNMKNKDGKTPYQIALQYNNTKAIEIFKLHES